MINKNKHKQYRLTRHYQIPTINPKSSGHSIEPPFKHKPAVESVAIPRKVIDPPPLLPFGGTAVPERELPDPLGGEANPVATSEDFEFCRFAEGAEHLQRHASCLVPLELVEVETSNKDGGAGRVESERGLEAADHEDPVAVAANEAGALEDIEDIPPLLAVEARPRRRRSCGDVAGEEFPVAAPGGTHVAESKSGVVDEERGAGFGGEVRGEFEPLRRAVAVEGGEFG